MVYFFHKECGPYLKGEKLPTPSSISNTKLIDGVPPLSANESSRFIRIIYIDQTHKSNSLPPLPPSLAAKQSFRRGANFAVGGATALERAFFVDKGFEAVCPFNVSLSVQLGWFDALKPSLCSSPRACKEYLAEALFVVGELGWNDYAVMLLAGKSVDEAGSHVPEIVGSICAATEKLIKEGGKTVVVSGIPPLGCAPANLEVMANQTGGEYDPGTGCLRGLNQLSKDHNAQLRGALARLGGALARLGGALARLGGRSPAGVRVVYADLYSPIIDFAAAPGRYGFEGTLRACCSGGGGGRYNVDHAALCGMPGPGVSACADPSKYVYWDGVHLTEADNRRIADGWLRGPYAHPPILSTTD